MPSHTKHNLATARTPRRRSDTVGHGSDTNSDSRRIAERHPRTRLGHASRNVDAAHEKVMKFLERQRERERDSGGVEAVVRRSISKYLPLRV